MNSRREFSAFSAWNELIEGNWWIRTLVGRLEIDEICFMRNPYDPIVCWNAVVVHTTELETVRGHKTQFSWLSAINCNLMLIVEAKRNSFLHWNRQFSRNFITQRNCFSVLQLNNDFPPFFLSLSLFEIKRHFFLQWNFFCSRTKNWKWNNRKTIPN